MMKGVYLIPIKESVNEEQYFDSNGKLKKYMDKEVLKQKKAE